MATQKLWDSCWIDAQLVTCCAKNGTTVIENGALGIIANKICWVGAMADLPAPPEKLAKMVCSAHQALITPGLIDCHTHLVFGGNRAAEFSQRLQGASYTDIARQGGGILSTVRATRLATADVLYEQSKKRLLQMLAGGVTTLEIKSGYGLDLATELKMLRVIKKLADDFPITLKATFLGAHALPPEFQDKNSYIDFVCEKMIPILTKEKLADAVDVFCENIAFDLDQTRRVFDTAKQFNLNVKLHAEQLSESHSVVLAAEYHALSVDHLEHLRSEASFAALASSGTVAVLLPGAYYFLRETTPPPIEKLRHSKIPMALATDCNPGTSPTTSLLLMLNMACTLFRITPAEALLGVTRHAAQALGLSATHGSLEAGKQADFVLWDCQHPDELAYYFGCNPCRAVIVNGQQISLRTL